jgi:hypothetical protein
MIEINEKWAEIHELKALLNATDYKVVKSYEIGTEVPQDDLDARQAARDRINALENEIAALVLQKEEILELL